MVCYITYILYYDDTQSDRNLVVVGDDQPADAFRFALHFRNYWDWFNCRAQTFGAHENVFRTIWIYKIVLSISVYCVNTIGDRLKKNMGLDDCRNEWRKEKNYDKRSRCRRSRCHTSTGPLHADLTQKASGKRDNVASTNRNILLPTPGLKPQQHRHRYYPLVMRTTRGTNIGSIVCPGHVYV